MQKVSFNLKMNGWLNTLVIKTEANQTIINDIAKVTYEIIGVTEGNAILNLKTSILTLETPIIIPSYNGGNDKTFNKFKIPKFTLIQIKDYLIIW